MSQKTLFTKSALAVAVALISTQAWSAAGLIQGKVQLPMMQVTLAVTPH